MEQELEVKILGEDVEEIKKRALSMGAVLISHEKQQNIVIKSSTYDLIEPDSYLRIRILEDLENDIYKNQLTFKKKVHNKTVRENYEYTVEFDDINAMKEILKNLTLDDMREGFKDRYSYEFEGGRLDFDYWDEKTYPYPYLEIEVKNIDDLDRILELLKISKDSVSTKSITQLQEELKEKTNGKI